MRKALTKQSMLTLFLMLLLSWFQSEAVASDLDNWDVIYRGDVLPSKADPPWLVELAPDSRLAIEDGALRVTHTSAPWENFARMTQYWEMSPADRAVTAFSVRTMMSSHLAGSWIGLNPIRMYATITNKIPFLLFSKM